MLNLWLILAESDILSDYADGLGSDVQERGYARTKRERRNAKHDKNILCHSGALPLPCCTMAKDPDFETGSCASLLVLVTLSLHAFVVFVLRHFFASFFLDGSHFCSP